MYKVFLNASIVCFASEYNCLSDQEDIYLFDGENFNEMLDRVVNLEKSTENECLVVIDPCMGQLWNAFRNFFVQVPAAGGLVRNNKNEWLFIKRFGYWDLPKGKIDSGELPDQAALREVQEECGIDDLTIKTQLTSTYHMYRSPYHDNNLVLKETSWYLMEYHGCQLPVPQNEEGIEEVKWVDVSELDPILNNTYPSIIDLITRSLPV